MLPAEAEVGQKTSPRIRSGVCSPTRRKRRPGRPQSQMIVSRYLDRIAITLSTICIVHCLAMPLVIAVLPIAALTAGNDGHFHALMLWLVVPTSAVGFAIGY